MDLYEYEDISTFKISKTINRLTAYLNSLRKIKSDFSSMNSNSTSDYLNKILENIKFNKNTRLQNLKRNKNMDSQCGIQLEKEFKKENELRKIILKYKDDKVIHQALTDHQFENSKEYSSSKYRTNRNFKMSTKTESDYILKDDSETKHLQNSFRDLGKFYYDNPPSKYFQHRKANSINSQLLLKESNKNKKKFHWKMNFKGEKIHHYRFSTIRNTKKLFNVYAGSIKSNIVLNQLRSRLSLFFQKNLTHMKKVSKFKKFK